MGQQGHMCRMQPTTTRSDGIFTLLGPLARKEKRPAEVVPESQPSHLHGLRVGQQDHELDENLNYLHKIITKHSIYSYQQTVIVCSSLSGDWLAVLPHFASDLRTCPSSSSHCGCSHRSATGNCYFVTRKKQKNIYKLSRDV